MDSLKQIVIQRLKQKGIDHSNIPGFMRCLANSVSLDPHMNIMQVNKQLHYLGWEGFDLDYHTLQLAISCFETDGLHHLHYKPGRWFLKNFNAYQH